MAESSDHQAPSAPLSASEAESLAQFMAAFSTASRLQLLYALTPVERTVEQLARATGLSPTVVSQQLRVLRMLHLVHGRRDGRYVRYRLYDHHVGELLAAIRHHDEHVAGNEHAGPVANAPRQTAPQR